MSTMQSPDRTSTPSLTTDDFEQLAQKVDQAYAEVQTLPPELRTKAMALKSAIEEFHKLGLTAIVKALKAEVAGKELLYQLVEIPEVYALLSMHGLIRADLRTQVGRVIEMVRPYMQSHGGDVALVDVVDRVVHVRLTGNCSGCSMSQITLKNTVEETIKQHIPEIVSVQVVDSEPLELVQLSVTAGTGWLEGPLIDELPVDRPFAFSHSGHEILILKSPNGWRAYRNACAHQGLPLDNAILDQTTGCINCPWHGFTFDSESGECLTAPQCQLESFPLRISQNRIYVRPE